MLSGATWSAAAIVGTPVFRIVVSSDSIKNATAISQGSSRLLELANDGSGEEASIGLGWLPFVELGCISLLGSLSSVRRKPIIADSHIDSGSSLKASKPRIQYQLNTSFRGGVSRHAHATFHNWKRAIELIFNTLARRRFQSSHNGTSCQF